MRTAQNKQSMCQAVCSVSALSLEKYIYWNTVYNNIQSTSFQDSLIQMKVGLTSNQIPLQKPNFWETNPLKYT